MSTWELNDVRLSWQHGTDEATFSIRGNEEHIDIEFLKELAEMIGRAVAEMGSR